MNAFRKLKEATILQIPNWLLFTFLLLLIFRSETDLYTLFSFFALIVATYTYSSNKNDWDTELIVTIVRVALFVAMILFAFLKEVYRVVEKLGF